MRGQLVRFAATVVPRRTLHHRAPPAPQQSLLQTLLSDLQILAIERPMALQVMAEQASELARPIRQRLKEQG